MSMKWWLWNGSAEDCVVLKRTFDKMGFHSISSRWIRHCLPQMCFKCHKCNGLFQACSLTPRWIGENLSFDLCNRSGPYYRFPKVEFVSKCAWIFRHLQCAFQLWCHSVILIRQGSSGRFEWLGQHRGNHEEHSNYCKLWGALAQLQCFFNNKPGSSPLRWHSFYVMSFAPEIVQLCLM